MNSFLNYVRDNRMLATIENVRAKRSFTLNLTNFELESLPGSIFSFNHDLLRLFLNNNKLKELPIEVLTFNSLHTLTLDYNNLTVLPCEICLLKNLVNLNVSYNPLKVLPPEIGQLSRLEVLWCNSVDISEIPSTIGQLKHLDTFGARNNRISEIPPEINQLVNLRWLTLENNQIKNVPENFSSLQKLIHLNLSRNQFTKVPEDLGKILTLQYVFMTHNNVDCLDGKQMKYLFHLRLLDVKGNPVVVCCDLKSFPFVCLEPDWEPPPSDTGVVNDSSDECWEHSVPSSEIDSTDESEPEWDDEEVFVGMLPNISRFAAIC